MSPNTPSPRRPEPARRARWRPALLSALVFPGMGQLAQRRWTTALVYGAGSLALVAVLLLRVYTEVNARLPKDPTELLDRLAGDPGWPLQLAAEIQRDNAAFFIGLTLAIVVVWILSVWDAWQNSAP